MATASIESRPSRIGSVATPMVIPCTSRMTIWSAPRWMPALRRIGASSVPCHRALPMKLPPTASETQVRVMSRSIMGRRIRSS